MTGPEQHAATVRGALDYMERITLSLGPGERTALLTDARAALDELVALARDTADELAHLKSEYHFDMDRGDHLVYHGEWERFGRWQRAVASGAAEAVDFVGAEQLAADRVNAAEARADELQRELDDLKKYRDAEARALATRLEQARREAEELQERLYAIENMPPDGYLAINVVAMRPGDELEQARREADQLRAAVLYHVTRDGEWTPFESHEHRCEGKCPDEDDMTVRDPLCLACLAMDFAALAGVQAEEQTT